MQQNNVRTVRIILGVYFVWYMDPAWKKKKDVSSFVKLDIWEVCT